MSDDQLEDEFELVFRGRKADLIELANVLHEGHHAKLDGRKYTPPDARMVRDLLGDLHEQLDVEAAKQAMADRLETGEVIVGDEIDATLQEVEDGG